MTTQPTKHEAASPDGPGTSSHEQLQGSPAEGATADRLNDKTPNERDESSRPTPSRRKEDAPESDLEIKQAHQDISEGLIDTERRGIPDHVPHEPQ